MYELSAGDGRNVTLRQLLDEYYRVRKFKKRTYNSYEANLRLYLTEWQHVPIMTLTRKAVLDKHAQLTEQFSGMTANGALRVVRCLMNFAIYRYELPMQNPVGVLSNCRAWNKVKRRTGHIAERDFAAWFKAVEQERDRTVKDYLKFLSLTGLRSEEASSLKWSDVDLNEGKFCVPDTKNGDPLYLPLAKYTWQMLRLRRDLNPAETFVFTGKYGKAFRIHTSHIRRIEWASGVKFNPHDLRRTYLTVGDSLDIPLHILKRLANHRQSQDITLSYIQTNVSRLREPVEKITQKIVSLWRS